MRLPRPLLLAAVALLAVGGTAAATPRPAAAPARVAPAPAAETLTYVTGARVAIPWEIPTPLRRATVSCPAGQVPASGGLVGYPDRFQFTVTSSYAEGRSWIITGRGEEALSSGEIAATVVCSSAPHHQVFGARVDLAKDETKIIRQPCPAGEVPTGGGGRGSGPGVMLKTSMPNLHTWEAWYYNNTGAAHHVEPFTVCSAAPHHVVVGRAGNVTKWGGTGTSVVQCQAGSRVKGGGGNSTSTVLIHSSFEGNGWRVHSRNLTAETQQVTALAVCAD
ncbi:hypothetical protein [Streptomyces sp. NPDC101132]|uniref:hypothetical protein n=1 Tax=Streptomyces sp. NPDC101132 TaxID=3366110 RepID=UPI0038210186